MTQENVITAVSDSCDKQAAPEVTVSADPINLPFEEKKAIHEINYELAKDQLNALVTAYNSLGDTLSQLLKTMTGTRPVIRQAKLPFAKRNFVMAMLTYLRQQDNHTADVRDVSKILRGLQCSNPHMIINTAVKQGQLLKTTFDNRLMIKLTEKGLAHMSDIALDKGGVNPYVS